jgi:hypothetical protein
VALFFLQLLSIFCCYGSEGFYQLAGGTNSYTIDCLKKAGLFQSRTFPGKLTFLVKLVMRRKELNV